MATRKTLKPIAATIGAAVVASTLTMGMANAADNPFAATELTSGYQLAGAEGNCGEGKCGEGKCGDKAKEASCGADKAEEGKCGEGKCGDKAKEGSCGGDKTEEGKCGEGKCGS